MAKLKTLLTATAGALALSAAPAAHAAGPEGPGIDALEILRDGRPAPSPVQNRFFVKQNRFELSPTIGFVPNNPFAQRFVGGVGLAYHLREWVAIQGQFAYSPDLGVADLKGLTTTLIRIASNSGDRNFQQPLDKVTLAFAASAVFSPLYGKINILGETVLNFDLYFMAGLSMNSKTNYFAREAADGSVELVPDDSEVKFGPNVGLGFNFYVNQSVAIKLDGRMNFYVDNAPQYEQDEPPTENRVYNNFVVGAGVSVFFPKMQERVYDF